MLSKEYEIGDYLSYKQSESASIKSESRRHMVTLLEALNHEKGYKEETLYLATSLADRFLVNLVIESIQTGAQQSEMPCLI